MPITQDLVESLSVPELVAQLPYTTERDTIISELRDEVPNWEANSEDLLYKMVENTANARFSTISTINTEGMAYFLINAAGDRLRARAVEYGITPNPGESDPTLRLRIFNRLEELSPSSESGILALPKTHPTLLIADTSIDLTNLQAPILYAARADGALLNATDLATLQVWMRHPDRSGPGWVLSVGTATRNDYTITATITYDARYTDRTLLESQVRSSAHDFIDRHTRLNTPINRAALFHALFIPGTLHRDVDPLITPAADIPAAASQIPVCEQNITGVALTFTDISP